MLRGRRTIIQRITALVLPLVLLAACAGPTAYAPLDGEFGYSDQRLEENRYRIQFTGNAATSRETVENYLLYRSAELTIERGFDYFTIAQSETENITRYVGISHDLGGVRRRDGSFIYHGARTADLTPVTAYRAFANIVMFNGIKPASDPDAYDARDLRRRLEALIVRPD